MSDLVVTVPKTFWREWLAEGDCAGDPPTGVEWGFYVATRPRIELGERLYIVAWDRLRGYAPVTRIVQTERGWAICRAAGAVAVTIPPEHWLHHKIKGFRGQRFRWWERSIEVPFPNWKTDGVRQ